METLALIIYAENPNMLWTSYMKDPLDDRRISLRSDDDSLFPSAHTFSKLEDSGGESASTSDFANVAFCKGP